MQIIFLKGCMSVDGQIFYFCCMIIIDNTNISDDLILVQFACNLKKCKGACCVAGDAGAPLSEEEISLLEDHIDKIKLFMTEAGKKAVDTNGVFDYDIAGDFVTPLVNGRECAYANFTNGIAWCAIEKAWEEGVIKFRKPVSCHLYPVRITSYASYDAVNYHAWDICRSALVNGRRIGMPLYVFLKDALIRKYGKLWYNKLEKEASRRLKQGNDKITLPGQ